MLWLVDDDCETVLDSNNDSNLCGLGSTKSRFSHVMTAGTYYVVVEGNGAAEGTPFALRMTYTSCNALLPPPSLQVPRPEQEQRLQAFEARRAELEKKLLHAAGGLNYTVLGGNPVGAPGDSLTVNTTASVAYAPGPENDSGALVASTATATDISFDEIESLAISGGSPLAINGTNGDDAITLIARHQCQQ